VAWNDSDANMRLQEEFVSSIVARCLDRRKSELAELERDVKPLEAVRPPFPRISYTDAVTKLKTLGSDMAWGRDLGSDEETLLAKQYDRPVMVFNYPKAVKAFYMKENRADPRTVLNNDVLAPEGYGEIIGGSQREDDYDKLLGRIRAEKLAGTWTSASTARSYTPGSGLAWSAPWRGSAASRTSARRSRSHVPCTSCGRDAMYVIVWEFTVRPEQREAFERGYGSDGDWARYFKRDESFRGVELWRGGELDDPEWDRYLTVDRWASVEAYEAFRERTDAEYQEMDNRFLDLCETETMLGIFEVVD